jgi:glutamate formiminotransferase
VPASPPIVECVVNVSEGQDDSVLDALSKSAGEALLDLHRDPHHHRAVFTLAGAPDDVAAATRSLATATVERLDLRAHDGVHPRLGVLDVVPFTPFEPRHAAPTDLTSVISLRDDFARWLADDLGVPSFLYGPLPGGRTRHLPDIRQYAFAPPTEGLTPDFGPPEPDPRTGATAVGARPVLIAFNVWISSIEAARRIAPQIRSPYVRALALQVGERAQVSCNLIEPNTFGPGHLVDAVATLAADASGRVEGTELVGLIPEAVLYGVPSPRWPKLGLSKDVTIEARLAAR